MAKTAFPSTRKWTSIEHRTSYRATTQLVKFYNNQLLNPSDTPLNAVKSGERPRYLICNSYSDAPLDELLRYLEFLDPSQILVLAPSIRSLRSPVRDLANKIALQYPHISCYIPTSDEEALAPTLLEGKLLFCTYHQAKGIEREAVIMFCFDTSFYKLYNKAGDTTAISNAQYVGATRSSQHLSVIHDTAYDYLPFLDRDRLADHCDMYIDREPLPDAIEDPEEKKKLPGYAVTDLTRHVPEAVTSYCFEGFFLPELERPPAKYRVYPPTTILLENGRGHHRNSHPRHLRISFPRDLYPPRKRPRRTLVSPLERQRTPPLRNRRINRPSLPTSPFHTPRPTPRPHPRNNDTK
jgi:hypothetical protein